MLPSWIDVGIKGFSVKSGHENGFSGQLLTGQIRRSILQSRFKSRHKIMYVIISLVVSYMRITHTVQLF